MTQPSCNAMDLVREEFQKDPKLEQHVWISKMLMAKTGVQGEEEEETLSARPMLRIDDCKASSPDQRTIIASFFLEKDGPILTVDICLDFFSCTTRTNLAKLRLIRCRLVNPPTSQQQQQQQQQQTTEPLFWDQPKTFETNFFENLDTWLDTVSSYLVFDHNRRHCLPVPTLVSVVHNVTSSTFTIPIRSEDNFSEETPMTRFALQWKWDPQSTAQEELTIVNNNNDNNAVSFIDPTSLDAMVCICDNDIASTIAFLMEHSLGEEAASNVHEEFRYEASTGRRRGDYEMSRLQRIQRNQEKLRRLGLLKNTCFQHAKRMRGRPRKHASASKSRIEQTLPPVDDSKSPLKSKLAVPSQEPAKKKAECSKTTDSSTQSKANCSNEELAEKPTTIGRQNVSARNCSIEQTSLPVDDSTPLRLTPQSKAQSQEPAKKKAERSKTTESSTQAAVDCSNKELVEEATTIGRQMQEQGMDDSSVPPSQMINDTAKKHTCDELTKDNRDSDFSDENKAQMSLSEPVAVAVDGGKELNQRSSLSTQVAVPPPILQLEEAEDHPIYERERDDDGKQAENPVLQDNGKQMDDSGSINRFDEQENVEDVVNSRSFPRDPPGEALQCCDLSQQQPSTPASPQRDELPIQRFHRTYQRDIVFNISTAPSRLEPDELPIQRFYKRYWKQELLKRDAITTAAATDNFLNSTSDDPCLDVACGESEANGDEETSDIGRGEGSRDVVLAPEDCTESVGWDESADTESTKQEEARSNGVALSILPLHRCAKADVRDVTMWGWAAPGVWGVLQESEERPKGGAPRHKLCDGGTGTSAWQPKALQQDPVQENDTAGPTMLYDQPKGRTPKGKTWDPLAGQWIRAVHKNSRLNATSAKQYILPNILHKESAMERPRSTRKKMNLPARSLWNVVTTVTEGPMKVGARIETLTERSMELGVNIETMSVLSKERSQDLDTHLGRKLEAGTGSPLETLRCTPPNSIAVDSSPEVSRTIKFDSHLPTETSWLHDDEKHWPNTLTFHAKRTMKQGSADGIHRKRKRGFVKSPLVQMTRKRRASPTRFGGKAHSMSPLERIAVCRRRATSPSLLEQLNPSPIITIDKRKAFNKKRRIDTLSGDKLQQLGKEQSSAAKTRFRPLKLQAVSPLAGGMGDSRGRTRKIQSYNWLSTE